MTAAVQQAAAEEADAEHADVLIVGAGLSGIAHDVLALRYGRIADGVISFSSPRPPGPTDPVSGSVSRISSLDRKPQVRGTSEPLV